MSRITISLALVLILAAPARAGTIAVEPGRQLDSGDRYVYVAAPGERNAVVVERLPGAIRLTDTGAPVSGCTPDGPNAVRCPRDLPVDVQAGDGDDTVTGDYALGGGDGGPGNDRLTTTDPVGASLAGGEGDDVLAGGPGMDSLTGGPGRDRASGGPGNDRLSEFGDRRSADVLDGGAGADTVSYFGRIRPLRVDLASGVGGQSGEGDRYANIENAEGGEAPDVLLGDAGRNELSVGESGSGDRLDGRAGDDLLTGGGGNEMLFGGEGADTLSGEGGADSYSGGPGADRLFLDLERHPIVRCGDGWDVVWGGADARLHADCERVREDGARIRIERDARGRARALRLHYETAEYTKPCRVRAKFSSDWHVLERRTLRAFPATIPIPAATRGYVRVTLHASSRCRGRFGEVHDVITFRLTS